MQRTAGITIIAGIILAILGESRPIIIEVYGGAANAQQIIDASRSQWVLAMALMAIGTLVAAVGLLLLVRYVQGLSDDSAVRTAGYVAAGAALASALLYAVSRYGDATTPWGSASALGPVLGMSVPVLWQVAGIAAGYMLLRAGYPRWLGWLTIGLSALLLVAFFALMGFWPPVFNFPATLILGIALLFVRGPQPSTSGARLSRAGA